MLFKHLEPLFLICEMRVIIVPPPRLLWELNKINRVKDSYWEVFNIYLVFLSIWVLPCTKDFHIHCHSYKLSLYIWQFGICLCSKWFHLILICFVFVFLFWNLGLIMAQQTSIHVNCFMARDAILSPKCMLWERGLVKLPQPWCVSLIWSAAC